MIEVSLKRNAYDFLVDRMLLVNFTYKTFIII